MTESNRFQDVADEMNQEPERMKHYVCFILDRSASMESIREEAIAAFNKQIESTRGALAGNDRIDVEVSLVTFSTRVDIPEIWCRPLETVKPVLLEDYIPDGWTAMYDAVGFAISKLNEQADINDKNTSVLIIIVSDGDENYSREWTGERIAQIVDEMQKTNRWTFVYEGDNQDLAKVSQVTNVSTGNMLQFAANAEGMGMATQSREMASLSYYDDLSHGVMSTQTFYSLPGEENDDGISHRQNISSTTPETVCDSDESDPPTR